MPFIEPVSDENASPAAAADFAADRERLGYVPTSSRLLAHHPAAVQAWQQLNGSIKAEMDLRRYELVTLAAAHATGSRHCRLAHGVKSLSVFDEAQLERIARDYRDAGLTDAEVEMMAFAERVATDAAAMTDADSLRLRAAGFSDQEIVDIAIAASARVYLGRMLQALAVDVDEAPSLSEPLRAALVSGI